MNKPTTTDVTDDLDVATAMVALGGSFMSDLGRLFLHADPHNRARIKAAFSDYWERYTEIVRLKVGPRP